MDGSTVQGVCGVGLLMDRTAWKVCEELGAFIPGNQGVPVETERRWVGSRWPTLPRASGLVCRGFWGRAGRSW